MKTLLYNLYLTCKRVCTKPVYAFFATVVMLGIFLLSVVLVNYEFVRFVVTSDLFTLAEQIKLLTQSFVSFTTVLPIYSQIGILVVAFLAGINAMFAVYYIKRRVTKQRDAGVGVFGILAALFGVGCGACGSVILSSIFGIGATTQALGLLPFKGFELTLIGIAILLGSTTYIAKKIQDPEVCPIY